MPKGGKRKGGTPEEEVWDAVKRMRKYPEHLESARNKSTWYNFLSEIGIYQDILESESGKGFWDRVRTKIIAEEKTPVSYRDITVRMLREANVKIETSFAIYRSPTGKFTTEPTGEKMLILRSKETGRFVSRKKL